MPAWAGVDSRRQPHALRVDLNIVRASERAADLTRQMLAYSGKGRFVIEPINLSLLIRDMSDLLHTSIPRKVNFQLDLQPDLSLMEGDPSQMQQLVINLVSNAAEAIGDSIGEIRVITGSERLTEEDIRAGIRGDGLRPGEFVCLEVFDSGSGMDEETMAKIFDPFFSTKFTGVGVWGSRRFPESCAATMEDSR